ncbi:FHA domain-containing protein [Roseibacterium sp. SDUM158016]|uniref:FHA domain-containing protein n=1 Tax=Roseicyclus sediminis TaxID=2980997 RepID=UPI0021D01A91|nr:FHA domain-containing protein [Roseibacterium sp. SDUM158016]MCU4652775.1 FHA domain-containing protein [Roseibacterium sp. SDUM158016]
MPSSRDLASGEAPRRAAAEAPPVSQPRRQIWDLDPSDEAAAAAPAPSRPHVPAAPVSDALPPRRFAPIEPRIDAVQPPEGEDMASRARRALAAAERQAAQRGAGMPDAGASPAMPDSGKTRVLGFHAPELEMDPISAVAHRSSPEVRFPAGWIVVVDGPGRGAFFAVTMSVSSIGRGDDQAIRLNFGDPSISRQNHAAIAYDAEQNRFFLGHGNKSNIVRRNGMPVLATEELFDGDVIRIGKTSLRFVALCGEGFTWGPDGGEDGLADD